MPFSVTFLFALFHRLQNPNGIVILLSVIPFGDLSNCTHALPLTLCPNFILATASDVNFFLITGLRDN